MQYDAIVVGLGPAGSTAARTLASRGLNVLGIDKEKFPRYKSCGGCISAKVERALDFDLSTVIEDTVYGAVFTYRTTRRLDILTDRPVGRNVMRASFDHLLVKKAVEAGAEVAQGARVVGISDDGAGVRVACADGETFSARFLIGADGASGVVGREHFGLRRKYCAVSVTAEVPFERDALDVSGRLFIDFGAIPFGYAWIFPKKDVLSVGIAADLERVGGRVKDHFESFVQGHEVLRALKVSGRTGWTVPMYSEGAMTLVKGRVVLAGDTGSLVDPFLGEGIYYAIRTGREAAAAVAGCLRGEHADLSVYAERLETEIFPEFRAASRLADLVYTHPRLWYGILERNPELMERYYDVIRGEEDAGSFYEWISSKVRSKPWKVLRGWVSSRFMPA